LCDDPPKITFDFEKCSVEDLMKVDWQFEHRINKTALLHGYCIYFNAVFDGADKVYTLETGPDHPVTHWY
jgi:hypothetical protein